MMQRIAPFVKLNLGFLLAGAAMVPLLLTTLPVFYEAGATMYELYNPVVSEWEVTAAEVEGDDLIVSGTMIKNRDCLFVPPTLARDQMTGRNYAVKSTAPTAGKTWAASPYAQEWGPWRIDGGAGKLLLFVNVYMCSNARPVATELGTYPTPPERKR